MTNTYTINDIQIEMQAAGSHWWDRGTLRFFRCRVGSQVYQGSGGVYFVTSEKGHDERRRYSVRRYVPGGPQRNHDCTECRHHWVSEVLLDPNTQNLSGEKRQDCPKCFKRNAMASPVKDGEPTIETIGEFNSMTRAQAHSLAKRMAGPAAIVAQSTYVPASPSSQLALDIVRGGGECTEPMAAYLIRLATAHQKAMEDYCNGVEIYDAEGEALPPLKRLRAKIQAAARDAGCSVVLSGDPCGCTVKLVLPDGSTDDWGKTGWCVPTRS